MGYKYYLQDLFDEVLLFLEGVCELTLACAYHGGYRVGRAWVRGYMWFLLFKGAEWTVARQLLEAVFSERVAFQSLERSRR